MEGLAEGLKGCQFIVICLVALLVLFAVASFVGWPVLISWWRYGVALVIGMIMGAWLKGLDV